MKYKSILLSLCIVVGLFFIVAQQAPPGCGPICGDGICSPGEVCEQDCGSICEDECEPGSRQCVTSNSLQICTRHADADTCYEWGDEYTCLPDKLCEDGYCVLNGTCIDTDGGSDFYVKGTVTVRNATGGLISNSTDECNNLIEVKEYNCGISNYVSSTTFNCTNGCSNGACIPDNQTNQTTDCSDTDGGLNYEVKGSVSGIPASGGGLYTFFDNCEGNPATSNTLREGYCVDNHPTTITHECEIDCVLGRCVSGTAPPGNGTNETGNETNSSLLVSVTVE